MSLSIEKIAGKFEIGSIDPEVSARVEFSGYENAEDFLKAASKISRDNFQHDQRISVVKISSMNRESGRLETNDVQRTAYATWLSNIDGLGWIESIQIVFHESDKNKQLEFEFIDLTIPGHRSNISKYAIPRRRFWITTGTDIHEKVRSISSFDSIGQIDKYNTIAMPYPTVKEIFDFAKSHLHTEGLDRLMQPVFVYVETDRNGREKELCSAQSMNPSEASHKRALTKLRLEKLKEGKIYIVQIQGLGRNRKKVYDNICHLSYGEK